MPGGQDKFSKVMEHKLCNISLNQKKTIYTNIFYNYCHKLTNILDHPATH